MEKTVINSNFKFPPILIGSRIKIHEKDECIIDNLRSLLYDNYGLTYNFSSKLYFNWNATTVMAVRKRTIPQLNSFGIVPFLNYHRTDQEPN